MLETIHETFLTEQQFQDLATSQPAVPAPQLPSPESPEIPKSILRQSVHWTKGFRDPIGAALSRINSAKNPPAVDPAIDAISPHAEVSHERADSIHSILPPAPATLPMFDTNRSNLVHDPSSASSPSQTDNRRFPRRRSECRVAMIRRADTVELTPREIDWVLESAYTVGRLQDLSQLGICLLLQKEIPEGTEVVLRITNDQIERSVDMSARVVRCQSTRPGFYSIHCQTLRDFTLDELQDLGQQPVPPRVFP